MLPLGRFEYFVTNARAAQGAGRRVCPAYSAKHFVVAIALVDSIGQTARNASTNRNVFTVAMTA